MGFFSRKASGPKAVAAPQQVQFLGEQDGPSEQNLKILLTRLFGQHASVSRAYLAVAHYAGDPAFRVVLALGGPTTPDPSLVQAIGVAFASLFSDRELLDIMFLSELQERELAAVCVPFFDRCAAPVVPGTVLAGC